jgi:hypothetical protein
MASLFVLTLGRPGLGFSQETPSMIEVKSILREASALIPMIDASQAWTIAANIAAKQTEAGDDEGALATRTLVKGPNRTRTGGGVAYSLAAEGRLPQALQPIAAMADGQEKAVAYWQVTQALLKTAKYDDALTVARLISKDPRETGRFLDCLLQIYAAQSKAGDRQGASATLSEALAAVEREPEIPPGMSKPMPTILVYSYRPGMFRSIVHALVLAGNPEAARTVIARISTMAVQEQDSEKKKGILGPLAAAQADVGDFTVALRTVEPIKSDFFAQQTVIAAIATEQARQGDVTEALVTLAGIPQGSNVGTLQAMSRTLSDLGNYSGARAVVDKMKGPGERAYGLASLAFEQCDKDPVGANLNVTLAWKLAQEERHQAQPFMFQNAVKFVAATRARLDDFTGALEIINGPDLQDKAWPLAVLAQAMISVGKKDAALALSKSQDAPLVRANSLLQIASSLMDQIEAANNKPKH